MEAAASEARRGGAQHCRPASCGRPPTREPLGASCGVPPPIHAPLGARRVYAATGPASTPRKRATRANRSGVKDDPCHRRGSTGPGSL